ncbi:nucleopolyhedrovirus P10 family protein [Streptomyces sp. HM190]|uniref:nucleopolyhedrovirus P10 family protein n=1 Tax=Streptomyces sp. HM190 TaxID=2695266 RepID=UPI001357CFF8|nr:nucleopolyhedrovirus P10 family protein [Streptomyces sp. HM190]
MTADGWTNAVRQQLGLGRVLPLGGPHDGAWITESAAEAVLRRATAAMRGVRIGTLRIGLASTAGARAPAVPAPPSALPPGPLRVTADFRASTVAPVEPFPATAARLRAGLAEAAADRLGLAVAEIDLRMTDLLGPDEPDGRPPRDAPGTAGPPVDHAPARPDAGEGEESQVTAAALGVAGVSRLTGALGGPGRAVHIGTGIGVGPALPRRHVRVELAVAESRRAVDVARDVRAAVGAALPDHPSVAVLVTAVE